MRLKRAIVFSSDNSKPTDWPNYFSSRPTKPVPCKTEISCALVVVDKHDTYVSPVSPVFFFYRNRLRAMTSGPSNLAWLLAAARSNRCRFTRCNFLRFLFTFFFTGFVWFFFIILLFFSFLVLFWVFFPLRYTLVFFFFFFSFICFPFFPLSFSYRFNFFSTCLLFLSAQCTF